MSEESKRKLALILAELREEYLLRFPHKIALLKSLTESRKWRDLEEEYHKLKGSGKTYGYPEVSTVCQKLESLLMQDLVQDTEIFDQAIGLLEKMHQSYLKDESFDLQQDPFARTLLALPLK